MAKQEDTIRFIPDRLNQEPVVFRGLTNTELFQTLGFSFFGWCPICVLIASFFGMGILGIGVAVLMSMLTLMVVGARLQAIKRNLPDGQHVVIFKRWLQKKGIKNSGYCLYSGSWDIRRSKR